MGWAKQAAVLCCLRLRDDSEVDGQVEHQEQYGGSEGSIHELSIQFQLERNVVFCPVGRFVIKTVERVEEEKNISGGNCTQHSICMLCICITRMI